MSCVLRVGVAVILLALGMVGCAGSGAGAKTESLQVEAQKEVAGLASSRWAALIRGELDKAYTYLSPGTRDVMPLDLYKSKIRTGRWKKASVDSVSCEQELCKVIMIIEYSYGDMKSVETRLEETWLQERGKWWYVPRK